MSVWWPTPMKKMQGCLIPSFWHVFNSTFPSLSASSSPIGLPGEHIWWWGWINDDTLCTVEEIYDLLVSLDVSKATGPDGISARMLKMTAALLLLYVSFLISHFELVVFHIDGNSLLLYLCQNVPLLPHQIVIDQSRYSVCLKLLNVMYMLSSQATSKFSPIGRITVGVLTRKFNYDCCLQPHTNGWAHFKWGKIACDFSIFEKLLISLHILLGYY